MLSVFTLPSTLQFYTFDNMKHLSELASNRNLSWNYKKSYNRGDASFKVHVSVTQIWSWSSIDTFHIQVQSSFENHSKAIPASATVYTCWRSVSIHQHGRPGPVALYLILNIIWIHGKPWNSPWCVIEPIRLFLAPYEIWVYDHMSHDHTAPPPEFLFVPLINSN